MKTNRLIKTLFSVLIPAFLFVACNKDKDNTEFEVFADAYIINRLIEDEVKSAPAFYVYANSGIASVTVTPPAGGGEPFELARSPESSYTFFKEPQTNDFKTVAPTPGIYLFEVESTGGDIIQANDLLEILNLEIPEIVSTNYQSESFSMQIKWESVANADGYVLKLLNNDGLTIFVSFAVSSSTTEYIISPATGNWLMQVYSGDNLTLQVQAFAYDSDATAENNIYNIGEISIGEKAITWGF